MIRLRRKNTAWLAVLGIVITLALLAAPVSLGVQFALIALLAIAAVASTVEIGRERESLINALKRAPVRQRISPHAKEALERARSRGGFTNNSLMLLDVGLISMQSGAEGMAFRRSRSVSKDDDGVRPYITLYVDASEAERNAMVRFEFYDQQGNQQFVHDMRVFLREGELNIMPEHHLPLAGNGKISGAGDWDLRVSIDGNLVGLHNFMLAPSMRERQSRLAGAEQHAAPLAIDDNFEYDIIDEVEQDVPARLQDLLQSKSVNIRPLEPKSSSTRAAEPPPPAVSNRSRTTNRSRR